MQQALETLPRYQAKQAPQLDIAFRLDAHYNTLMHDAQAKNPRDFWNSEMPKLSAQYAKDMEEYNKQAQWLLTLLEKAVAAGTKSFEVCVKCKESKMKQWAWDDFVALLRYKEYPVVLTMGEAAASDGYGSWREKVVTLTTPLQ